MIQILKLYQSLAKKEEIIKKLADIFKEKIDTLQSIVNKKNEDSKILIEKRFKLLQEKEKEFNNLIDNAIHEAQKIKIEQMLMPNVSPLDNMNMFNEAFDSVTKGKLQLITKKIQEKIEIKDEDAKKIVLRTKEIITWYFNYFNIFNTSPFLKFMTLFNDSKIFVSFLNETIIVDFNNKNPPPLSFLFLEMSSFDIPLDIILGNNKNNIIERDTRLQAKLQHIWKSMKSTASLSEEQKESKKLSSLSRSASNTSSSEEKKYIFVLKLISEIYDKLNNVTTLFTSQVYPSMVFIFTVLSDIITQEIITKLNSILNEVGIAQTLDKLHSNYIDSQTKILSYVKVKQDSKNNPRFVFKTNEHYLFLKHYNMNDKTKTTNESEIKNSSSYDEQYYYFGPFNDIFNHGETNPQIVDKLKYITDTIIEGKNVCIIGYGFGRKASLFYSDTDQDNGIIIEICRNEKIKSV